MTEAIGIEKFQHVQEDVAETIVALERPQGRWCAPPRRTRR